MDLLLKLLQGTLSKSQSIPIYPRGVTGLYAASTPIHLAICACTRSPFYLFVSIKIFY